MSSPGYRPQRHTCGQVVWVNVELGTYWDADPDHGRMITTCPECHERLTSAGFEDGWLWQAAQRQRETDEETDQEEQLVVPTVLQYLIAEHQAALEQDGPYAITHETIIMSLQQVQRGWVYAGQAARILAETAARVSDEPEKVALYRAAIAELARLAESQREE